MWLFYLIFIIGVSTCYCEEQDNVENVVVAATTLQPVPTNANLENETVSETNISRKNFPFDEDVPAVDNSKPRKGRKEETELEGVVLALSMKKFKSGSPKWYMLVKNAAQNLFSSFSQRRFKEIRFRGQDPSVTIDLKADAIIPALRELLASKQVQKILNTLASKAAIMYRAFQEDYVKDIKKKHSRESDLDI